MDVLTKKMMCEDFKEATFHVWCYGIALLQGCANVSYIQETMHCAQQ